MILHNLLGKHLPDVNGQRWDNGSFVTVCLVCGRAMVKPVSHDWQLAARQVRR